VVRRRSTALFFTAVAVASIAASCNAIFGIDPFEIYEPPPDAGAPDAEAPDAPSDTGSPEVCDASFDLEGCPCATPDASRECFHGVPGPDSGCNQPGEQRCAADGEAMRWGECKGGSTPEAEACFDSIDDDCDGLFNQGCRCSDHVDLCKLPEAGTPSMSGYNFFSIPSPAKAGEPFDVYILSGLPLDAPSIAFDGSCFGQGFAQVCLTGAGCQGWSALRLPFTNVPAGPHTIDLRLGDTNPTPCEVALTASWPFDVE
jgi:hypothetical protein